MGSRWQVDRSALNRGLRGGSSENRRRSWLVIGLVVLLLLAAAIVLFFLLRSSDETTVPLETTVPVSTASTVTTLAPVAIDSSSTTASATAPTTTSVVTTTTEPRPLDLSGVPVLTEEEAYDASGQARLLYVTGTANDWIIDLSTGELGQVADSPGGRVTAGLVVRDGSLIVESEGRIWRKPAGGEWSDLSLSPDGVFSIVGYYPSDDHLHVYLTEEADGGFGAARLHNVQLFYNEPDAFEPKWIADGADVVRVASSGDHTLVLVERAQSGEAPAYEFLTEVSGSAAPQDVAPVSDPPSVYVWGAEFLDDRRLFYMECVDVDAFASCGASVAKVIDLRGGAPSDARDELPGFSTEFALPGETSPMAASYENVVLLTRNNVTLVDLISGDRVRILRGSER